MAKAITQLTKPTRPSVNYRHVVKQSTDFLGASLSVNDSASVLIIDISPCGF